MAKFKPLKRWCKNCGKSFVATRPWHIFCSSSCRTEHWKKEHPYFSYEEIKKLKAELNKNG